MKYFLNNAKCLNSFFDISWKKLEFYLNLGKIINFDPLEHFFFFEILIFFIIILFPNDVVNLVSQQRKWF